MGVSLEIDSNLVFNPLTNLVNKNEILNSENAITFKSLLLTQEELFQVALGQNQTSMSAKKFVEFHLGAQSKCVEVSLSNELEKVFLPFSDKPPLKELSNPIWQCQEIIKNSEGEEFYKFKCEEKFRTLISLNPVKINRLGKLNVESVNEQLFPALIDYDFTLFPLLPEMTVELLAEIYKKRNPSKVGAELNDIILRRAKAKMQYREIYMALGYAFEINEQGSFFTVPSIETLQKRWDALVLKTPGLANLEFVSSKGIATDKQFIKTYAKRRKVLISEGEENVHDHHYHVMRIIQTVLAGHHQVRDFIADCIALAYKTMGDRLEEILKKNGVPPAEYARFKSYVTKILGAHVDLTMSQRDLSGFDKLYSKDFGKTPHFKIFNNFDGLKQKSWLDFFTGQFGNAFKNDLPVLEKVLKDLFPFQ